MKYINFSVFIDKQNLSIDKKIIILSIDLKCIVFSKDRILLRSCLRNLPLSTRVMSFAHSYGSLMCLEFVFVCDGNKDEFTFPCIHLVSCLRAIYCQSLRPSTPALPLGCNAQLPGSKGHRWLGWFLSCSLVSLFVLWQYQGAYTFTCSKDPYCVVWTNLSPHLLFIRF